MSTPLNLLIGSYLEPELVARVEAVDARIRVLYEPDLIGAPRFIADHTSPIERTPEQRQRWHALLAQADIMFDFDRGTVNQLAQLAPNLKWLQATSAGIGQLVKQSGLADTDIVFTTASGVHAIPLAEYCLMSMLMFTKLAFHLAAEKERKHWARYCSGELRDQTLAVVGLGRVGSEVARLARAVGMRVIGTKRRPEGIDPQSLHADALYAWTDLHAMLAEADFVVLIVPHTAETTGLIDAAALAAMKPGAVLINIARGTVIDEEAMIAALRSGHLGGAALDVFAVEPLPAESPLWEMPNVLISPHSASTAVRENERIVDLFCDNLHRYLAGEPLRNVLDKERLY
ncbi:D-2-hydroxyacid dehydrogenase [bacterium]|nr:D-2-hydroxyacid dehydrogenase [bacterium]